MVRNPAVFLLDEPLSNLDAKLRTSMRTEIIKLHKKLATTFIYVTHDQTEAMTMGDRIVVMKDGIIQQVDTPQNLYLSLIHICASSPFCGGKKHRQRHILRCCVDSACGPGIKKKGCRVVEHNSLVYKLIDVYKRQVLGAL